MLILLLVSVLLLSSKVEGIESPVLLYPYEYCCPPTCALADTANVTRPVKACDKDNHPLSSYHQGDLACDASHGGSAYICADQSPWAVNETTSYGFAEVAGAPCCACYHLSLVSRPGDHLTRTIVVQNIRQPALGPERNLITIFTPGILSPDTCSFHYSDGEQYPLVTVGNRSACDSLKPVWRDGCRWQSDWVKSNTSANVSEVPCPAALTEKSGCRRKDEVRLLPSTLPASIFKISTSQSTSVPLESPSFIASQPSIPTLSSSPEPASTGLSTRKKIVLGVIVSVVSLLLALLIYWRIRRRSKTVKEEPRADETPPAAAPGYEKPELQGIGICELAAASLPELNPDNIHEASTGATASELHPTHLLEMDASDLPELDAISSSNKPAEERLEAMQNPTNRLQAA